MRGRVIMYCLLWLCQQWNTIWFYRYWGNWRRVLNKAGRCCSFQRTYCMDAYMQVFCFTIFDFPIVQTIAYCIFNSITNEVHINAANNATTKRNWLRVVRYFNNKRHFSFPLTRRHTVSYFNFYYYCHLQFNTFFFPIAHLFDVLFLYRFCFVCFTCFTFVPSLTFLRLFFNWFRFRFRFLCLILSWLIVWPHEIAFLFTIEFNME